MIRVQVDSEEKLVEAQISGFVTVDEAMRVSNELKKALGQFGPKDAILLIDLVGFAPMTTDVLPILRGMGRDIVSYFRRAALIQDFSMDMQGRKIIEPPPGYRLPSYPTRERALQYLKEEA